MPPSAIVFKLTKPGGITRRLAFFSQPSWSALSGKVSTLFNIPSADVGVSYIDSDGDEVTLSSEEELQDFFGNLNQGDEAIKFTVQDLSSLRSNPAHSRAPSTAPQQPLRHTFGGNEGFSIMFDAEEEWQRLPDIIGTPLLSPPERASTHAFVEVVSSEAGVESRSDGRHGEPSVDHLSSALHIGEKDPKGKQRVSLQPSVQEELESTNSLLESHTPAKPPIHVFDVSDTEDLYQDAPSRQQTTIDLSEARDRTVSPHSDITDKGESIKSSPAQDPDPPLPSIESQQSKSTPSLFRDLEAFLTTASGVLSSHPELSERLRNILLNATSGTYWATHREALYRTGEHIQRTAAAETGRTVQELRKATEEQARIRVTEALNALFRSLGGSGDGAQGPVQEAASSGSAPAETPTTLPAAEDFSHQMSAAGILPPPPPPVPGASSPFSAPPPPPPPFPSGQRSLFGLPPRGSGPWARGGPPRPPIPPIPPFVRPFKDITSISEGRATANIMNRYSWAGPMEWIPPHPPAPPGPMEPMAEPTTVLADPAVSAMHHTAPGMEQARADVEAAKAMYKAKKNAYRQMRAEKRRNQVPGQEDSPQTSAESVQANAQHANLSGHSALPEPASINAKGPTTTITPIGQTPATPSRNLPSPAVMVSNPRGLWPGYEMISVPRRNHTIGHTSAQSTRNFESSEARSMQRITRKLADMGFTESAHPDLRTRVKKYMPADGAPVKDAEDDIVTNIIEELLGASPNPRASNSTLPQPRASTFADESLPGAWD